MRGEKWRGPAPSPSPFFAPQECYCNNSAFLKTLLSHRLFQLPAEQIAHTLANLKLRRESETKYSHIAVTKTLKGITTIQLSSLTVRDAEIIT